MSAQALWRRADQWADDHTASNPEKNSRREYEQRSVMRSAYSNLFLLMYVGRYKSSVGLQKTHYLFIFKFQHMWMMPVAFWCFWTHCLIWLNHLFSLAHAWSTTKSATLTLLQSVTQLCYWFLVIFIPSYYTSSFSSSFFRCPSLLFVQLSRQNVWLVGKIMLLHMVMWKERPVILAVLLKL